MARDRLTVENLIAQQRDTIASLKRGGHETADAERHLRNLEDELGAAEKRREDAA